MTVLSVIKKVAGKYKKNHTAVCVWYCTSNITAQSGPVHPPELSICPLHTHSGGGKEKQAHINWSMVTYQGSTRSELP